MTDFCSIDGRLTPLGEGLPGGVYLYQRLRTVDYRPLHTAAHLSRLRDGAGSLFGRPAELPAGRIADEIGALLHANGYPAGGATVTLRLYADGTYALTADGVSLYRTYALRSLRPAAAVVPCDGYRPEWPTSARRETARWAQQEAERIVARRDMADAFEATAKLLSEGARPRTAAVLLSDAYAQAQTESLTYDTIDAVKAAHVCELVDSGAISHASARELIVALMKGDIDVDEYVKAHTMSQISDMAAIEDAVRAIVGESAELVARVRAGKLSAINALVGLTMKRMAGRGNARIIREVIEKILQL